MEEPIKPRRRSSGQAVKDREERDASYREKIERIKEEGDEQLRALKLENSQRRQKYEAELEARKRPRLTSRADIPGSFLIDELKLAELDRRIAEHSGSVGKWSLSLVGDRTASAENLTELLATSIVTTRSIKRITARYSGDAPSLTEVSLILDARSGVDLDIESRDNAKLSVIESDVRELMASCKTWHSWAYNTAIYIFAWVIFFVVVMSMTASIGIKAGLSRSAVVDLLYPTFLLAIFIPLMGFEAIRRRLMPRVQFAIGHSQGDVVRRQSILTRTAWVLGPGLIGSVVWQAWANLWTGGG